MKIITVLKLNGNSVFIAIIFFVHNNYLIKELYLLYSCPLKGQKSIKREIFSSKLCPNYFICLFAKCLYFLFFISIVLKFWKITKTFEQNNKITLEISKKKNHNFQNCSHYLWVSDHVQATMVMSITNNSNSLRNVLLYNLS